MDDTKKDLRRERGEGTRRELVRATIAAVALHGLAGTTLNVVAGIAGVSRALVGFHFKSKDQLLIAALENSLDIYDSSLHAALTRAKSDPRSQLSALLAHDMSFVTEHAELLSLWCAVWGEAHSANHYRASVLPADRRYRDEIAAHLNALLGDASEARKRAAAINAFTFGIWLECHLDPKGFNVARARQTASALLKALSVPVAPG
jgi:TetR/AcrR family transcriptional repressor of bet genes